MIIQKKHHEVDKDKILQLESELEEQKIKSNQLQKFITRLERQEQHRFNVLKNIYLRPTGLNKFIQNIAEQQAQMNLGLNKGKKKKRKLKKVI